MTASSGRESGEIRAASSSRSRATSAESSTVLPGASPNQNGMVAGAPCAFDTTTSPPRTYLTGHDLLREDVQRRLGNRHAIEPAGADGPHQGQAFEQFIPA